MSRWVYWSYFALWSLAGGILIGRGVPGPGADVALFGDGLVAGLALAMAVRR